MQPSITGSVVSNTTTTTVPSLSAQAAGLLHNVLNTTGHLLSPISNGLLPNNPNATTQAPIVTTGHSLSQSPVSEMVTEVTSVNSSLKAFNATTVVSILTSTSSPITGTPNVSSVTHSLRPHELAQDQEHGFLMHGIVLQTALVMGLVALIVGLVFILRKKHLDRLRHHLMPVYNFDPSDDGEDWETELLDDQFVHCPPTDAPAPIASGQLKLDTGLTRGLRIQNNNSSSSSSGAQKSSSMSPTAMSGLLSGGESGPSSRRMYTNERDPVA